MNSHLAPPIAAARRRRATRASVLGDRRVSSVTVSRVDPAELQAAMQDKKHNVAARLDAEVVEVRDAYKHADAMNVVGVRHRKNK